MALEGQTDRIAMVKMRWKQ